MTDEAPIDSMAPLRLLEHAVFDEAKRAQSLTEALLSLLAYEAAYHQRRINSLKTTERDADFARGSLMTCKKTAQRLKGEFKNDH